MRYLLNSAVITAPGRYEYRIVDKNDARRFVAEGGWQSRIGYPATAEYIERLCGVRPSLSRDAVEMQPGDAALVVRLTYRLQNPAEKKDWQPEDSDFELGLLKRTA